MYYLFRIFYALASAKILSKIWWIFYYLDFIRKPVVYKNLDIAFPNLPKKDKIKIAKNTYKNFASSFEDTIDFIKHKEKMESIKIINEDILKQAVKSRKPVILMSAHFGNWEIGPRIIADKYIPFAVIMREIDNEKINRFFVKVRSHPNIRVIYRKKAAKEMLKALLREKRALGILIDQYTRSKNAVKVNFFKPDTVFNPAISKIAKATGAVVIPTFGYKKNGTYVVEFKEPKTFDKNKDTIESFTQWQADVIENIVRTYPDQYYWFHNRWKER
jgi:KDO2-lipid IV(A) lauroyltransferase